MKLPKHLHCKFCEDLAPFKEEYCDDECRKNEADRVAAKRHKDLVFYRSAGIIVVALIVIRFLFL